MNGRWLARLLAAALLLGAAPRSIGPATPPAGESPLLVTVGETTAGSTRLWLRVESHVARVQVAPMDGGAPVVREARPDPGRDYTAVVELDHLRPGVRYVYDVQADGARASGAFTANPAPDADRPVRLHWSGDLGGAGHCRDAEDGYRIFRAMTRRAPDLFLFVGDTIYADHPCGGTPQVRLPVSVADSLDRFRAKHRYNRTDPAVQAFFRTTSVYPIWDDHEVRNNFVGPEEPLMPSGRRAFQEYFPVLGPPEEPGRLYRAIRWGRHVEIFILDTRQYRSSNAAPDGPHKTMLGAAQRRWFLDAAAASDATWKLVVSSVPLGIFTGGRTADSWSSANVLGYPRPGAGFAYERDLLLSELRTRGVRNVVFLTGDVHHGELIRHQPAPNYVVHEFTAGPLSARQGYPRFLDRSLHSRSLASLGFALNFGELVADATTLTARIIDASGTIRARTTLRDKGERMIDLKLEMAEAAVRTAQAKARALGTPMTVTVVDEAGRLVLSARGDGTGFLTPETSRAKATAAAAFRKSTAELTAQGAKGWGFWQVMPIVAQGEVLPTLGGAPIVVGGRVVGGIGCGGGTGEQDQECADAGAAAVKA